MGWVFFCSKSSFVTSYFMSTIHYFTYYYIRLENKSWCSLTDDCIRNYIVGKVYFAIKSHVVQVVLNL